MNVDNCWVKNWQGAPKYSKETRPIATYCSLPQIPRGLTWDGTWAAAGEKPGTPLLSYVTSMSEVRTYVYLYYISLDGFMHYVWVGYTWKVVYPLLKTIFGFAISLKNTSQEAVIILSCNQCVLSALIKTRFVVMTRKPQLRSCNDTFRSGAKCSNYV
jgi:hypothetical protein